MLSMLAIHASSGTLVDEWIAHCKRNDIDYKQVDCFSTDIIDQLKGCHALLWHWAHSDYRAQLFARQLIASVEELGLIAFPNTDTSWHYDDKVGQKYLLEAISAPFIPTHVFYSKDEALQWIEGATFPKVWKLRGGAGSQNVRLVKSKRSAKRIVKRSFNKGWSNSRTHALKERVWRFRRDKTFASLFDIVRGIGRLVFPHGNNRNSLRQIHYVYFQDFVPNNSFDIRIQVIGERAFGVKRFARSNDFRASGSGKLDYDPQHIPAECLRIAFDVAKRLRSQSLAFDFVSQDDEYLIVEISYGFPRNFYAKCPGYWDSALRWREGKVTPGSFIIEDIVSLLERSQIDR
jgi:glutathione synthase/RimK-type ligase-like ATP-grasp enzyme